MPSGAFERLPVIDASVDDDQSSEVNFGAPVKLLSIYVPTITSATVDIQAAIDVINSDDTTGAQWEDVATDVLGGAGTGDEVASLDLATDVNGYQHYRITTSAGQGADRTFRLIGKLS